MDNTSVTSFRMTAYTLMENNTALPFTIFLLLYITTISLSLLLIAIIYNQKALHEPMYMFLCNLTVNGLYGSSVLLPATMSLLVSETHEISLSWCQTQIFFLHTYASVELTSLAVMGYDRYIAICYPLHYRSIMSVSRVYKLVAFSWIYPYIVFGTFFSLTLQLTFCERDIHKLFCVNFELVKNSCSNTSHISIVGLVLIAFLILPQLLMIIFSYAQIFKVCLQLSKESQVKALKTCIPHLMSVVNYSLGSFFEILQSRFDMSHTPYEARLFMSLHFPVSTPLLNPAIYGMGTRAIRVHFFKIFCPRNRLAPKQ